VHLKPPPCPECCYDLVVGSTVDGDADPASIPEPEPVYCRTCGRQRQVFHIVEVVVTTREQAERWGPIGPAD